MSNYRYKVETFEEANGSKEWKELIGVISPIMDCSTLDESLDFGKIIVQQTRRKENIPRFTPIRITSYQTSPKRLGDQEKDWVTTETHFYRMVESSVVQLKKFTPPFIYQHNINTIEFTKLLERTNLDSLTFTNPLGKQYENAIFYQDWNFETRASKGSGIVPSKVAKDSVVVLQKIQDIVTINDFWEYAPSYDRKIIITAPNGETEEFNANNDIDYTVKISGVYKITYDYLIERDSPIASDSEIVNESYTFNVLSSFKDKTPYTFTEMVNRVLHGGVPYRMGLEKPKYRLDEKIAEKYKTYEMPEMAITRSTLFEGLLQIGSVIQAIPRLEWNEEENEANIITFDELGTDEEWTPYGTEYAYLSEESIDEYCGEIDSIVENMANTKGVNEERNRGAIIYPDLYKNITPRSEAGQVIISNDSAIIKLPSAIERITKVEMTMRNADTAITHDITDWLYEAAEYETLGSTIDDQFPNAKRFAIYYEIGGKEIKGLTFRAQGATSADIDNYAIVNILKSKGLDVSNDLVIKDLEFKITYVPYITGRVKQRKAYLEPNRDVAMIFNQAANFVETDFYGKHMRNSIAKLGEKVIKYTFYAIHTDQIPRPGQKYLGLYIATVDKEYQYKGCKFTITLTKDFNKLAEYIGINSNYRISDVSERQVFDRHINYSTDIVVGDSAEMPANSLWQDHGLQAFKNTFIQTDAEMVTSAIVQGYGKNNEKIGSLMLLTSSAFSCGNSLGFTFFFQDNYGAGEQSKEISAQRAVGHLLPYTDGYGEVESFEIKLGHFPKTGRINTPNDLPAISDKEMFGYKSALDFGENRLVVMKDNRETPNITIQTHFVANRRSLVLGSALANNNGLVAFGDSKRVPKLIFLPYKLNMLKDYILAGSGGEETAWSADKVSVDIFSKKIVIAPTVNNTGKTWQSWALYDSVNGTIYIGENGEIADGESTKEIVFNF